MAIQLKTKNIFYHEYERYTARTLENTVTKKEEKKNIKNNKVPPVILLLQ